MADGDGPTLCALGDTVLGGITRDGIITLAKEEGLQVEERPISLDEVTGALSKAAG